MGTVPTNRLPEELDRAEIFKLQGERLASLIAAVANSNPFWTAKWSAAGVNPSAVRKLDDLQRLPFTSKQELTDDQARNHPYGSNLTFPVTKYSRFHQTSGTTGAPVRWLDTPESWGWFVGLWGQIYRLAGVTAEDRIAFPFSFGPFLGFWAAFDGAAEFGALCLPGGGMSSTARLRLITDNCATVVCCTPTYALRLAEVAADEGIDLASGSVRKLIVAGEPGGSIPAIRERIESLWNARVYDHWGMTELGSLAMECTENPGGVHLLEADCIPEIVNPQTGEPVENGHVGELVMTNLGRIGSPLIRYRTGDLVQADTSPCVCGRQLIRLKGGVLGRVDDMFVVRGNNVYPSAIEAIVREFKDVVEYRIELETRRAMPHLKLEIEPTAESHSQNGAAGLVAQVSRALSNRLNFQPEVVAVLPGSLPRFELKGRRFFRQPPA
ncbi:MAG: phenylacetate--CoA ligase family protein [Planctomycetaceae bacterium]